jgi:WhiB family redox-sensing transcriptional regulator
MSRGALAAHGTTTEVATSDWRHQALCLQTDPEQFWPIGDTQTPGPSRDQADEAKAWCARCPVWAECREFALDGGETAGVWGGMTGAELVSLRRRNARIRAAVERTGAPPPRPVTTVAPYLLDATPVRDVILDRHAAGWSYLDIARRLGVSETTTRDLAGGSRNWVTQRVADAANALLVGAW